MSITSRINEMSSHIEQAYDELQGLGADLTNVNKNIENISMVLDDIYDSMPQVSGEGTSLTLDDTRVGKIKSTLKGNTSQTGTPTPSSPIPINVVSGDNKVLINSKNVFNLSDKSQTTHSNGLTYKVENNVITVSGTNTSSSSYSLISWTDNATENYYNDLFQKGETFTLSANNNIAGVYFQFNYYKEGSSSQSKLANLDNLGSKITFTIPNDFSKVGSIFIGIYGTATTINGDFSFQLEKGNDKTIFEPYQEGNTYNIDLPVENLLPISSLASTTSNGITFTNNNDGTYTLNGTATAEATFYIFGGNTEIKANSKLTFSCKELIEGTRIFWYDNWAIISGAEQRIGSGKPNYTTTNEITTISQLRVNISVVSGTTVNNLTIKPMLEKGSKANSYTPHGTTPIELCKIGNYQDYFYKDSDKWYLHKEIGKVVLNGSENWNKSTSYPGNYYCQSTVPYAIAFNVNCFNNLTNIFWDSLTQLSNGDNGIMLEGGGTNKTIDFKMSSISTLADFKTFLGNNNLLLYYILATPTNTEITYQPLINQLNELEKAMSKDGQTNISQVNNDLPFIISASALKEWQESNSLNSTLSMVNPLSLGNTLNTQENNTQPIEVDNIEPLEEEENEES